MQSLSGHTRDVRCVAFTPDGRLVSGSSDRTVRVWDLSTGDCRSIIHAKFVVYAVAVSPDGRTLAFAGRYRHAGSRSNSVYFWDLAADKSDGEWEVTWQDHRPRSIWALSFSADGSMLGAAWRYLGSGNNPDGGGGGVYRMKSRKPLAPLPMDTYTFAFSPVGRRCAIGNLSTVSFHSSPTARGLPTYPLQCEWASAISFAGDAAIIGAKSVLHIVNCRKQAKPVRLKTKHQTVTAIGVPHHLRTMIVGGRPGGVDVYELATHSLLRTYDFGIGGVHALAISTDGLTFAVAGDKGLIRCDLENL